MRFEDLNIPIKSLTSAAEKKALWDAALECEGNALEVGVWHGYNLLLMAEAFKESGNPGKIIGIDTFVLPPGNAYGPLDYDEVARTVLPYPSISLIRGDSQKLGPAWTLPLGLLVVDGRHDADFVFNDLNNFSPALVPGAAAFVHDYYDAGWQGVQAGTDKFLALAGNFHACVRVGSFNILIRDVNGKHKD